MKSNSSLLDISTSDMICWHQSHDQSFRTRTYWVKTSINFHYFAFFKQIFVHNFDDSWTGNLTGPFSAISIMNFSAERLLSARSRLVAQLMSIFDFWGVNMDLTLVKLLLLPFLWTWKRIKCNYCVNNVYTLKFEYSFFSEYQRGLWKASFLRKTP